jgi:hypothetical protein
MWFIGIDASPASPGHDTKPSCACTLECDHAGIIRSDSLQGWDDRPTSARVTFSRRSEGSLEQLLYLLLSSPPRSRGKPCHGTGFRYRSRPTALYVNRAFDCNANDVAHTATSPPAVPWHGGRHHIRPRTVRRFVPTALYGHEGSTMDVFVAGIPGLDDPEPLYVSGRSVVIVNTLAGCGFRRGCDPTPLYVRGHSDVNTKNV